MTHHEHFHGSGDCDADFCCDCAKRVGRENLVKTGATHGGEPWMSCLRCAAIPEAVKDLRCAEKTLALYEHCFAHPLYLHVERRDFYAAEIAKLRVSIGALRAQTLQGAA